MRIGKLSLALCALALLVVPETAAATAPVLPRTPAGRITVLTANAAELLNGADIAETTDTGRLAARMQLVFDALNDRGPAVPNYAPDVVLLQEVTHESATRIAQQFTSVTGYSYRVGADALPGTAAWEQHTTLPYVMRETAVLYNASTMQTASSPAASLLTYPQSQIPAGQSVQSWVSMRQSVIALRQLSSGRTYAAYSAHYRPDVFVRDHDAYTVSWTNFLKKRLAEVHPGATPIIGGDLNNHHGAYLAPFATSTADSPGTYHVAQPQSPASVDVVASTEPLLASNYDYDYKTYGTGLPSYFDSATTFLRCDALHGSGQGDSAEARSIRGCTQRYYSDHSFVWAVFGT